MSDPDRSALHCSRQLCASHFQVQVKAKFRKKTLRGVLAVILVGELVMIPGAGFNVVIEPDDPQRPRS
jgi:hypothetical protein